MNIEKVSWGGWPNCYRLSNDDVELIVTTDVGPRVMRYAFIGGPNVFLELADELGSPARRSFGLAAVIVCGARRNDIRYRGRRTISPSKCGCKARIRSS